ncbi:hypothetical protein VCE7224_02951 [Vibrio celticus]|uniref:Uncharacterized protein n=1 Tax=Vibrio celticus TaxID=446372 RepID=A0A1C3JGC0_9VIBR|nr:hypothetical protein VCE7224_02951 [Vibrio celticus]
MNKTVLAIAIGVVPHIALADYDSISNYQGKPATQPHD